MQARDMHRGSLMQNVISWSLENCVYNKRTSGSAPCKADKQHVHKYTATQDADNTKEKAWN